MLERSGPKMEVEILSTTLVKPFAALLDGGDANTFTGSPDTSPSTFIPLTVFDQAVSDIYIGVVTAFSPPTPTNTAMKAALSKLLSHLPRLAGKITYDDRHRPGILIDHDACVPVIDTHIKGRLADFLPMKPTPEITRLHPETKGLGRIMSIQLNRFDCGGLLIGLVASHKVGDGQSFSKLFVAWGRLARGLELKPGPVDDTSVLVPRNPPRAEFPHQDTEFGGGSRNKLPKWVDPDEIENVIITFSTEFLGKLKDKANYGRDGGAGGYKHSTFQCLLAQVWRKVSEARGLAEDETTYLRVLVNGRPRLMISEDFFGNLVLWAYPSSKVKDLLQGGLSYGAKLIKQAVDRVGTRYFQSFIDFGKIKEEEELVATTKNRGNLMSPNLRVTSWLGFEFHQMDLGGGGSTAFLPTWMPTEGFLIFAPSSNDNGSVDVYITLIREHAQKFREIAHQID